jgi:uncharacterized protein (DUF1800 family)
MRIFFHSFLRFLIAACALSAAGFALAADPVLGPEDAAFLLARTGFAPTAAEIDAIARLTRGQAVDRLLAGTVTAAATPAPALEDFLAPSKYRGATPDERKALRESETRQAFALRGWWLREMLATPTPLTERMTLFWHNHFVSGQQKVQRTRLMYEQNVLFRQNALGNFRGLLHAASKDPAMIVYLDGASNRKGSPNENFAREVMELFTLGEGHYTEADVKEAARAFTGWSLEPETGAFAFRPRLHDDGIKTVLGRSGALDGDAVLDILLAQPACAEFIVGKLWREFVSPEPDQAEVRRIAARFRANYEIKPMLRDLLLSPVFWQPATRGTLVRSPVELVVGTIRQFEFRYADPLPFSVAVAQLGQNLFNPPNVKGWPGGDAWINSSSLLARKNVLERLFRAVEGKPQAMAAVTEAPEAPAMDRAMAQPGMQQVRQRIAELGKVQGQNALGREGRIQFANAASAISFSPGAFLSHYNATPDSAPDVRQRLAIQHAVLALEPSAPINSDLAGVSYLRMLVLDPVYQLK